MDFDENKFNTERIVIIYNYFIPRTLKCSNRNNLNKYYKIINM